MTPGASVDGETIVRMATGQGVDQTVDIGSNAGALVQRGPIIDANVHGGQAIDDDRVKLFDRTICRCYFAI